MEVLEHHPMVRVVAVVEQVEQDKLVNRLIQGQQMLLVGLVEQEQQVQLTDHQLQEQVVVEAVQAEIQDHPLEQVDQLVRVVELAELEVLTVLQEQ
jgi:hypothetical protein